MNRQLYEGGGIMSLSKEGIGGGDYKGIDMGSRVGYGIIKKIFRGAKKAVKGAAGAVKDIASSDIGKAALAGAAVYGLGGGTFFGRTLPGIGSTSGFGFKNIAPNLFGTGAVADYGTGTKGILGSLGLTPGFGIKGITKRGIGTAIAGSGLIAGLLTKAQMEEIDEADPDERGDIVAEKLRQSLTRLGVSGEELERRVAEGVSEYTGYTSKAECGRIGFDEGSPRFNIDDIDFDAMQDIMPKLELEDDKSIPMPKVEEDDILIPGPDGEIKVKPLKGIENLQASVQYELPFEKPLFVVKQAGKFFGVFEQKDGSRILLPMDKSGSRLNLANAGPVLPPDTTQPVNPFGPKPGDFGIEEDIPIKMASNEISIDKIEMLIKRGADNDLIKEFTGASDGVINQIRDAIERKNKAGGGIMNRMNYALGDTASQNAMQAAGIEGLPIRQNPKGVKELDLRDNGGFIPPVGIKEKEDDIPAMLSNNEFVFTADAVRGMGDGDVELGAQRMYDQMKMLEKGGRV